MPCRGGSDTAGRAGRPAADLLRKVPASASFQNSAAARSRWWPHPRRQHRALPQRVGRPDCKPQCGHRRRSPLEPRLGRTRRKVAHADSATSRRREVMAAPDPRLGGGRGRSLMANNAPAAAARATARSRGLRPLVSSVQFHGASVRCPETSSRRAPQIPPAPPARHSPASGNTCAASRGGHRSFIAPSSAPRFDARTLQPTAPGSE